MGKGGATISKIVEETKRPRGTVATILRKYRLRGNVFQTAKRTGRPQKTTSIPSHFAETFLTTSCRKVTQAQSHYFARSQRTSPSNQRIVTSWKNNHCLESLEWPAQSPDLNTIENLWMALMKAISKDAFHQKLILTCRL